LIAASVGLGVEAIGGLKDKIKSLNISPSPAVVTHEATYDLLLIPGKPNFTIEIRSRNYSTIISF
jgi:hypothetical protein